MIAFIKQHWLSLLVFVLGILIVQGLGNLATMKEIPTWYAGLNKAPWNPPNWLFGPMWSVLYMMIAVAGWRLWVLTPGTAAQKFRAPVIRLYFIQLFLNLIWSPVFFGLHLTAPALTILLLLVIFVILTIRAAKPVDRIAMWLLVPYLLWITYATTLNAAIVYLN